MIRLEFGNPNHKAFVDAVKHERGKYYAESFLAKNIGKHTEEKKLYDEFVKERKFLKDKKFSLSPYDLQKQKTVVADLKEKVIDAIMKPIVEQLEKEYLKSSTTS